MKVSFSRKVKISLRRIVWALISFTIPRRRPLEVIYGRARYCLCMFDSDVTADDCAKNWVMLKQIMNSNCVLALSALYGDSETLDIILMVDDMQSAGRAIYERKDEMMSYDDRLLLAKDCWRDMRIQVLNFLNTEPENVQTGAKKHCQSLIVRKYAFEETSILSFPFYSL